MKSKCISCVVIAIIGATIGMILAYFFVNSVNADNFVSGAILGGSIGLYFGVSAAVPAGDPNSCRQSGIGGMG